MRYELATRGKEIIPMPCKDLDEVLTLARFLQKNGFRPRKMNDEAGVSHWILRELHHIILGQGTITFVYTCERYDK